MACAVWIKAYSFAILNSVLHLCLENYGEELEENKKYWRQAIIHKQKVGIN